MHNRLSVMAAAAETQFNRAKVAARESGCDNWRIHAAAGSFLDANWGRYGNAGCLGRKENSGG
jgi:hypothetical protein